MHQARFSARKAKSCGFSRGTPGEHEVFAPRARRRRKPENPVVKRRAKRAPPQNLLRHGTAEKLKSPKVLTVQLGEVGDYWRRSCLFSIMAARQYLHRAWLKISPKVLMDFMLQPPPYQHQHSLSPWRYSTGRLWETSMPF